MKREQPCRSPAFIFVIETRNNDEKESTIALPYGEELWRCRQAQKQGLTGRDTPECAQQLFAQT